MSEKIELTVVALSTSESQPNNYVLILEDVSGQRRVPIIIGQPEAQAIAIAMEQMHPPRPLTHDLMKNMLTALGGTLTEVMIHTLEEETFHASIKIKSADGSVIDTDARPSDAIALAVRCGAPIFSYEKVIAEAGILADSMTGRATGGSLANYNLAELEELLQKVIEKEDYESASKIRDIIDRRKR